MRLSLMSRVRILATGRQLSMAGAKSRVSKRKFYRYGFLTFLTLLCCVVVFPGVGRSVTSFDMATPSIASPGVQSVQLPPSDLAKNALTLEQQARSLYEVGQFAQAVDVLQQALQGYQAHGDSLGEAIARSNIALNYQQLGRTQEAMQEITLALELVRQAKNSPEKLGIWAQSLDVQGSLQLARGEAQAAADSWEQAAKLYQQLGNPNRAIFSRINQAQALQTLGLYRRAISTLQAVNTTLRTSPNSLAKAASFRSLGDALRIVGDFQQAEQRLRESLKIAQNLQSPDAIASAYLSLGNLVHAEGKLKDTQKQPDVAQEKWERAIGFYQQAAIQEASDLTQIQAQLNRLRLLIEREKWQEAGTLYPQVQQQLVNLPPGRYNIDAQVNFAQSLMMLLSQNQPHSDPTLDSPTPPDIAQVLNVAYQQAEQLGDRRSQAFALGNLGHLYELQQQWPEAQKLSQQALVLSQSLMAPELDYRFSWQLGRILKRQGQYQHAIDAYNEAYQKSRSLRRDLVSTNPDVQFSFRESVEPLYRQFVDLLLQSPQPAQTNLSTARQVLETLQIEELENFLNFVCPETQLFLDEVIDSKDPQAAIIYPVILDDRVELILRLPRQQALYHPPATQVSKPEIEAILDRLYSTLQEDGAYEEVQTDGQTLYNWLIEPLKTPLEQNQIQTLVFVLDGAFRKIPMSALYDGEQYLVENYTISLIPGLQLRDPEPLRRGEMKVLAASLTDPPENVPGFAKLANVQKEMEEIKETGISVTEISEEKFTMANFSQKLLNTSFDVVHLATHGQFGSTPENTFLITAEGTLNIDEFEQLFRNQRQTGEQAIQLLIMSACQTATGNEQEILGLAGMTVQAGASSAIGSLWDLDDEAGALFTEAFYRYLGQPNISRAEALRRAQVALLDNENYDHPRYWAPYILVGLWL